MSAARADLAARIQGVRFTPVRLREGYDMGAVDDFLDQLAAAISAGRPVGPMVDVVRFASVRLREGYDMADVDSFLAEIAGLADGTTVPAPTGPAPASSSATSPASSVITEQKGFVARLFGRKS